MTRPATTWKLLVLLVVCAGLSAFVCARPAAAAEVSYAAAPQNPYFEDFSKSMFDLERDLTDWYTRHFSGNGTTVTVPWWLGTGVHNFVTNLINEPLTLLSSVLAGDFLNALNSTQRLFLNTVFGMGGFIDVASMAGLPENHYDLGLSMCVHGVPAGPYVFLPFIGPRTMRDAVMDYVVAYTLYVYIASILTGPSPPILLFVLAKNGLWFAEMATMKQMDVEVAENFRPVDPDDFDAMRETYLRRRNYRCQTLRHEVYN